MPFTREEINRTVAEHLALIDGGINGIRIHERVVLIGTNGLSRDTPALIDTGSTTSILNSNMAREIGAVDTDRQAEPTTFLDGMERTCESNKFYAKLKIPSLFGDEEFGFVFTVCDRVDLCQEGNPPIEVNHPVIGMDILRKLRLVVDTTKSCDSLSIKPATT